MRVHVVVPDSFDDPTRPSGGNVYDRRVCAGLAAAGWDVRITPVAGVWPVCDPAAVNTLSRAVAAIPDRETMLIDGLVACPSAALLLPEMHRLHSVVLLHMPLATASVARSDPAALRSERAVLQTADRVVVPSEWTRQQLLSRGTAPAGRIHVARPGVDRAPAVPPQDSTQRLLCVATLSHDKGQDLLVDALARLADTNWTCVLAGRLDHDPGFVHRLRDRIAQSGLGDRVRIAGVLTGTAVHRAYAQTDLLVVPSRSETYGMVVTEALAHAVPVLATAVGGLPEALGFATDGSRPGQLVSAHSSLAMATALAQWLRSEPHRWRLRTAALRRRSTLGGWEQTVRDVAAALTVTGRQHPRQTGGG